MTGEKSRFKPRNLIIQLVGEDENSNIAYEAVPSNLRIELGRRYHVAVRVSLAEHTVAFLVQDLDDPNAAPQAAVVPTVVRSKLMNGASSLVIGGLNKRSPAHHWDGRIEAARIAAGKLSDAELSADPAKWKAGFVNWSATLGESQQFAWNGADAKTVEAADPFRQTMNDLCQVLLNMNEFFYLH